MSSTKKIFDECKRSFKILEEQVERDSKAYDAYERRWEGTLSAVSQGKYDSCEGLVKFVSELYSQIESLKSRERDTESENRELRKRLDTDIPF